MHKTSKAYRLNKKINKFLADHYTFGVADTGEEEARCLHCPAKFFARVLPKQKVFAYAAVPVFPVRSMISHIDVCLQEGKYDL